MSAICSWSSCRVVPLRSWRCPANGLPLEDKQQTSKKLLELGAEIHELNTVRKHLSAIKGGWLAAAHAGSVRSRWRLSDVVGDDLSSIGSGPTVPDATTFREALAVLDGHGGRESYPASVVDSLTRGAAGEVARDSEAGRPATGALDARVIGGGRTAVEGARGAAASLGYRGARGRASRLIGEARNAA